MANQIGYHSKKNLKATDKINRKSYNSAASKVEKNVL